MYKYIYFYNMMNINKYEHMNNEIAFFNMMRSCSKKISPRENYTIEESRLIGKYLNITFDKFDIEQFRIGLTIELKHGTIHPFTNITNDDSILTGKIALAHLNEYPDYYTRLSKMEEEAGKYWAD